jgi:hypothetical protein
MHGLAFTARAAVRGVKRFTHSPFTGLLDPYAQAIATASKAASVRLLATIHGRRSRPAPHFNRANVMITREARYVIAGADRRRGCEHGAPNAPQLRHHADARVLPSGVEFLAFLVGALPTVRGNFFWGKAGAQPATGIRNVSASDQNLVRWQLRRRSRARSAEAPAPIGTSGARLHGTPCSPSADESRNRGLATSLAADRSCLNLPSPSLKVSAIPLYPRDDRPALTKRVSSCPTR